MVGDAPDSEDEYETLLAAASPAERPSRPASLQASLGAQFRMHPLG